MAPVTFTGEQLLNLTSIPSHDYIMASQLANGNTPQAPATASTDASSQADYFVSSQSSTTNSSRTSAEFQDRSAVAAAAAAATNTIKKAKDTNPLPPLSRDFPKPSEEIDVAEALSRKPGRWTFQGAMAVNRPVPIVDEEKAKAKRIKALEDVKKELFASSAALNSASASSHKNDH